MILARSEVYFVNLDPVQGREQRGRRPVLIVSSEEINRLPLVVTVVIGTNGANRSRDYRTDVRVTAEESGLPIETVFLCFQIRSLDAKRFPDQPAGKLSDEKMKEIETAMRYCLGL